MSRPSDSQIQRVQTLEESLGLRAGSAPRTYVHDHTGAVRIQTIGVDLDLAEQLATQRSLVAEAVMLLRKVRPFFGMMERAHPIALAVGEDIDRWLRKIVPASMR